MLAVDVHRASPAYGDAAAKFGAAEAERIAQHPEHWRVAGDIRLLQFAVQAKRDHGWPLATDLRSGSLESHGAPLRIQFPADSSDATFSGGGNCRPQPRC